MRDASVPARRDISALGGHILRKYGTVLALVGICVFFAAIRPGIFPTVTNIRNILEQVSILAVVATTQTVVMVVGDFDLSVGTVGSFAGVAAGFLMLHHFGVVPAIILGLLCGAAAGTFNGFLVSYLGLSAFVTTLATLTAFEGASLLWAKGTTLFGFSESFINIAKSRLGPIQLLLIIAIVVLLAGWLVLTRTTLGRRWYAIGGNREAAFLSGVRVKRLRLLAFTVSGLGAAAAGILLATKLASAHPTAAEPQMLTSIAAVFLGMTCFKDGQANIPGTLVGLLILGVLSNGLNITHVNSYIVEIITGGVMVFAILLSQLAKRRA
jgi:ribose transport system permease protein